MSCWPYFPRSALLLLVATAACSNEAPGTGGDSVDASGSAPASSSGDADPSSTTANPDTDDGSEHVGDGTSAAGSSDGDDPDADDTADTDDTVVCPDGALAPGRYEGLTFPFEGDTRTYDLYVPSGFDGRTPLSLVVNLHAYLSNTTLQADFSQFDTAAEAGGVAVIYPQATFNSWNAGACCGEAQLSGHDDVAFIRALVEEAKLRVCFDPKRVYATGMSNGGFMTHRLACEAADLFAAAAPVAGVLGLAPEECTPSRPVPILDFHGTADTVVLYGGGAFESFGETFEGWAARNGCVGEPTRIIDVGEAYCDSYATCNDGVEVTFCTVEGGGHCWPGNPNCYGLFSTTALSANDMMLEFFSRYTLP